MESTRFLWLLLLITKYLKVGLCTEKRSLVKQARTLFLGGRGSWKAAVLGKDSQEPNLLPQSASLLAIVLGLASSGHRAPASGVAVVPVMFFALTPLPSQFLDLLIPVIRVGLSQEPL